MKEQAWAAAMRAERQGDQARYEWLLADISRALRVAVGRRAPGLGVPAAEVEDIVQEVLIGLHMMRRRWEAERPFLPWLHAIVRYKLTDAMRRRTRERHHRVELSFAEWADITDGNNQDEIIMNTHDRDAALAQLPEGQRDVVAALAVDGASVREAAERFATSEGAIRMTLHRALKKLTSLAVGDETK